MEKTKVDVLIVVDMQNDFVTGALGTPEAKAIVPKVVEKIEGWKGEVLYTLDTHHKKYLETQEGKHLPVQHCIYGTKGWQLVDEVENAAHKPTELFDLDEYEKNTFGSVDLMDELQSFNSGEMYGINSITLIGLCTDICVISNAMLFKAAMPEVPIIVDANCCAGVTPESHKNALAAMKMCQIEIVNEE